MIVLPTRIVYVMRAPVLRAPIELHTLQTNVNVHLILYVLIHVDSKKRARAGEGGGPSLRLLCAYTSIYTGVNVEVFLGPQCFEVRLHTF